MPEPLNETAVALVRAAVGAPPEAAARTFGVRRLDRDASYVLVQLGSPGQPGWVAAVDPGAGDVMTWAANPSGRSSVPTVPTTGFEPVGTGENELVWRPSAASRSPLYPLLRMVTAAGEVFLDLNGTEHHELGGSRG